MRVPRIQGKGADSLLRSAPKYFGAMNYRIQIQENEPRREKAILVR